MNKKEIDGLIEHLEDNFNVMEQCNQTLKKMKKIEEVLDGEE